MIDTVATFSNEYIKQVKQESRLNPSKDHLNCQRM